MNQWLSLAGALVLSHVGWSQNFLDKQAAGLTDQIYDNLIYSARLFPEGNEQGAPLLYLGQGDQLLLSFDDLATEFREFSYSLEHCDRNWQPSNLPLNDYYDGFPDVLFPQGDNSFNTVVPYVHYETLIPGRDGTLKRSGNYRVKIFANGNKEQPVLILHFMVCEPLVAIAATLRAPARLELRDEAHEIDFTVNLNDLQPTDIYGELNAVVLQNRRWDNAKTDLKPVFIKGRELVYDFNREATFMAGNEYRNFNISSLRFRSEQIARINQNDDGTYQIFINPTGKRTFSQYFFYNDLNGRYVVRNSDMTNADTEADYLQAQFLLPLDDPMLSGQVYVFGQTSLYGFPESHRMVYDEKLRGYTASIWIKQGFYDFAYMFVPDETGAGDFGALEGNHFETRNEYTILMYYTDLTLRHDRLVGAYTFAGPQ